MWHCQHSWHLEALDFPVKIEVSKRENELMRADLDKQSSELSVAVRRPCLSEVTLDLQSIAGGKLCDVSYVFFPFPLLFPCICLKGKLELETQAWQSDMKDIF